MQRWGGEVRRHGTAWRGSGSDGTGKGSSIFTCGGYKSGKIPWEQAIPAPGQTVQSRAPEPGR